MTRKKLVYYLILFFLPIITVLALYHDTTFIRNEYVEWFVIFLSVALSITSLFCYNCGQRLGYRLTLVLNAIFSVIITTLSILHIYNIAYIFSSIANLRLFILSTGQFGMLVFVLIQMAQVVVVPIPAGIITLAGAAIWGPLIGGLLDSVGVLLGSYLSFGLGKIFGFRLVSYITGKDNATKYAKIINDRGKFFLFYAFLLPLFPDDILCLIAGITTMPFKYFFLISVITRPIGVMCMSYFGSGSVVPFSGWGIPIWIGIIVIAIASVIVLTKYQNQIEEKLLNTLFKRKNKQKKT